MSKYLWEQLPADNKSNYFTLGIEDIIIPGTVTDVIDEYNTGTGIKSTDLLSKYSRLQGCMKIDLVVENIGTARNNPHYLVTGEKG
jgi:hypothetical protein